MFRSLLYIVVLLGITACGKEQGVEARLHEPTKNVPQEIIQQASRTLPSKNSQYSKSVSSDAIRNDTLGFRVKSVANKDGSTNLRVEHFEGYDSDAKCRNTVHELKIEAGAKVAQGSTISVSCLDNACNYIMIVLEQGLSSFVDNNGSLVQAYVPLVLEKVVEHGGTYFKPMLTSTTPFLKLENNTTCPKSDQVVRYPVQYAVSPVDDSIDQPYEYFSDPYNNTWVY